MVERLLAEDGVAERLLSEGGLIDKITAKDGPLEQLADVADTLSSAGAGHGGAGAGHRHAAGRRHGAHHGGQSAEQYRRPHPVSRVRSTRRSSSRPVPSQRVIDADG